MSLENHDVKVDLVGGEDLDISPLTTLEPTLQVASFEEAGVSEAVIKVVHNIGWTAPTPVQGMCLPLTTKGRDVAGFAQTGTGKTGVFVITVAERLYSAEPPERKRSDVAVPEVLVLTPTRELTMQIDDDANNICDYFMMMVSPTQRKDGRTQ